MDGTPLADPSDLAVWFPGVDVDDAKLNAALVEASNRFRGAVRHSVSVESRIVVLDGYGTRYLSLPAMNVDVDSVVCTLNDTAEAIPVSASTSGIVARTDGAVFPNGLGNVVVEFTAGWPEDEIPPEIQAVVVDQAKVLYSLKRGIQWLAVGGISMSVSATDATGVTQAWSDVVELYRVRAGDRA